VWIYTCAALHPECRFGLISSAHRDAVAAARAREEAEFPALLAGFTA
jgi:hypothetical protein